VVRKQKGGQHFRYAYADNFPIHGSAKRTDRLLQLRDPTEYFITYIPCTTVTIALRITSSHNYHHTNTTTMSDSGLSSALSSPPSSEDEAPQSLLIRHNPSASPSEPSSDDDAQNDTSITRKKRTVSPPREEVLADNPDIAVSKCASKTALSRVCKSLANLCS
jgi:hypothetical protein